MANAAYFRRVLGAKGKVNDNDDEDDDLLERFFKVEAWWNFQMDGSLSDRVEGGLEVGLVVAIFAPHNFITI